MNFQSFFLLSIQEYLATEMPEIQYIDLDLRQEQAQLTPAIPFPALLIDFYSTTYSQQSGLGLFADATINIRLITNPITPSYADAPIDIRRDSLRGFEQEQKLITLLHGYTPDESIMQPLNLTAASTNTSSTAIRSRSLTFTTAYEQ